MYRIELRIQMEIRVEGIEESLRTSIKSCLECPALSDVTLLEKMEKREDLDYNIVKR